MVKNVFRRQGYLIEFASYGSEVEMCVNGNFHSKGRRSKALTLANWATDCLGLSIERKTSWASIDEALVAHGYTMAPAYYLQQRGKLLSYFTIVREAAIEVSEWPTQTEQTVHHI